MDGIKFSQRSLILIINDLFSLQPRRGAFGGVLPKGHGNDGLLQDLRRLLNEAQDLEDNFDDVLRPNRSPPALRPVSVSNSLNFFFAKFFFFQS